MASNVKRIIYCFWMGNNPLSENRKKSIQSLQEKSNIEVCVVTASTMKNFELQDNPFHKAFSYLSDVHKADYLRCYFMHHYGGGYSDVKPTTGSWVSGFNQIDSEKLWAVGYPEIEKFGVARGAKGLKNKWRELIGNCAYIFRPKTPFTQEWIDELHHRLDKKYDLLVQHPPQTIYEFKAKNLSELKNPLQWFLYKSLKFIFVRMTRLSFLVNLLGYNAIMKLLYFLCQLIGVKVSLYPIEWSEILGDIFHTVCYKYKEKTSQALPSPVFKNYR